MTDTPVSAAVDTAPPPSAGSAFPLFLFAGIFTAGATMMLAGGWMILMAAGGLDGALSSVTDAIRPSDAGGSFATSVARGSIAPKIKELMDDLAYRLEDAYDKQALRGHEHNVQRAPETRALADHPDVLKMTISFDVPQEGIGVLWQREAVVPMARISRSGAVRQAGEVRYKDETYLGADQTRQPLRIYTLERKVNNTGVRLKILVYAARD